MEKKQILDLIFGFAGLSILVWLFFFALKDLLAKEAAKRKISHNVIILILSMAYIIKIVAKDLLPILK